ncbi:MAG: hypothetical protein JWR67_2969 [Mucilaginibacter sp.]|nr:hypothetical protein [Mucilaginibacter sp.]MDB5111855.1 hypothetical protein [Mucilaginibacter sp.]
MRFVLCLLFIAMCCNAAFAEPQVTPAPVNNYQVTDTTTHPTQISLLDSVVLATKAREKFIADSISMQYIKYPDSALSKQFIAHTLKENLYAGANFLDIPFKTKSILKDGHNRKTRDQWIIFTIIGLLIYTALLNITLNKDIKNVLQSFYSKRAVSQAGKDESYINFWAFIGLFLLFGFTFGLFLCQLATYNNAYYSISGVRLFVSLSFIIIALFAVKFLALKIIGFIFDINKLVSEYISILCLTYFNIAFVFLPVALCFSLLDAKFIPYLLAIALLLIVLILIWLYLRSSVNIISNFRFHKFYLFIYLCALEICPILILIKALNI